MSSWLIQLTIYASTIILTVFIVMWGKVSKSKAEAIGKSSFEKLAHDLMEDNAYLKIKLAIIEEKLASIDRVLKEVE